MFAELFTKALNALSGGRLDQIETNRQLRKIYLALLAEIRQEFLRAGLEEYKDFIATPRVFYLSDNPRVNAFWREGKNLDLLHRFLKIQGAKDGYNNAKRQSEHPVYVAYWLDWRVGDGRYTREGLGVQEGQN